MPWKIETPPDQQREDFVREALRREKPFKELCQQHRISRKTGYKWLKRSGEEGTKSLGDRRRGPRQSSVNVASAQWKLRILEQKKNIPAGDRKNYLRA
jgi:putative transposase